MTLQSRALRLGFIAIACIAAVAVGVTWLAQSLASRSPAPAAASAAGRLSLPGGPLSPPVRICGNESILGGGPTTAPKGAVTIPVGDDSDTVLAHNWTIEPHTTYWFAPGRHTLGSGEFSQIIPADGDTFIGAPGAVLDGQHQNLHAFTQLASDVTIRFLTIQDFGAPGDDGGQGVVNTSAGSGWHIDHVTLRNNAGAGVMLGSDNVLSYSCLQDNGQYGVQAGGSHISVDHNEIVGNNADNWEARQKGCGCSGGAKFWDSNGVTITSNYVHDNLGPGLWADTDNRGFEVENNYFASNQGEGFIYEISYNLRLVHNTFVRNALVGGPNVGGFPDPAVYISGSGADARVPGPYGGVLAITGNTFIDNWAGVVLWEDANRYCASGANTSTGYCTLVDPSVATIANCGNPRLIGVMPYYSDCRWKTQNVLVSQNTFTFNPRSIGADCTPAKFCGFNGIFSEWGSWSPYSGAIVANHIAFDQHNNFKSNAYNGPWRFIVGLQNNVVSWASWQGIPYHQDVGSSMNPSGA